MKLEQQCCSLELAKKLKALNVKQESLFVWYQSNHSIMTADVGKKFWYCTHKNNNLSWNTESISAFTVAELGEMLPAELSNGWHLYIGHPIGLSMSDWKVGYGPGNEKAIEIRYDTEADARAKMLCYLVENKLINI